MSNYAERLATSLRNAYEAHDREAFEHELRRMVATMKYTGPTTNDERAEPPPVQWPQAIPGADRNGAAKACARVLHPCECETEQERSVCMHRTRVWSR